MESNSTRNVTAMPYEERIRAYERQKRVAKLVCATPEEYEAMVKHLADVWDV